MVIVGEKLAPFLIFLAVIFERQPTGSFIFFFMLLSGVGFAPGSILHFCRLQTRKLLFVLGEQKKHFL